MELEQFVLIQRSTAVLSYQSVAVFSNEKLSSVSARFHSREGSTNKNVELRELSDGIKCIDAVTFSFLKDLMPMSKCEIMWPYVFGKESMTQHSYKRMLRYFSFQRRVQYPRNT